MARTSTSEKVPRGTESGQPGSVSSGTFEMCSEWAIRTSAVGPSSWVTSDRRMKDVSRLVVVDGACVPRPDLTLVELQIVGVEVSLDEVDEVGVDASRLSAQPVVGNRRNAANWLRE